MELQDSAADSTGDQQLQEKQHFHVLAVDDSHVDRKLLERLLTISSYQVTCVDSGEKALEYLGLLDIEDNGCERSSPSSSAASCCPSSFKLSQQQASKVNLIMTDYSMPGMSGYDLLKRIKESSCKDIPVVVMSSENVPSRINMCLEGGAEEFLLKPVKVSDLRKLHALLRMMNTIRHESDDGHEHTGICNDVGKTVSNTDKEDMKENESNNCSVNNVSTKRKAALSTSLDRRPRVVQELPVS